jgi:choline dehydrogenase-like flavoprotein
MYICNLSDFEKNDELACDVCVVGSGPAGSTLVRELAGSGLRIILLESGGQKVQTRSDALSEIESIGAGRDMDQSRVRNRILGGSSHTWSGRCAPFDAIDYRARPWVPHSGWPMTPQTLQPFLERTPDHLGLGLATDYTGTGFYARTGREPPQRRLDERLVEPFFWQFSRDFYQPHDHMRFGRALLSQQLRDIRIITNATVLHIDTNPQVTAVKSLQVASDDGKFWTISARTVVLCAGGIENARLLLASNRVAKQGLGNGRDLVGRYLMDHPRGSVATFDLTRVRGLSAHFGFHRAMHRKRRYLFAQGLHLSPAVQERESLLNCTAWLSEQVSHDDPWSAVKRLLVGGARFRRDLGAIARHPLLVGRGVHAHLLRGGSLPRLLEKLQLTCTVEQTPNPTSRVTLANRCDRFGVPFSRVDWRIGEAEQRTVRRMAQLVSEELQRVGIVPPVLDEWVRLGNGFPEHYRDNAHPTGTTRMSQTPATGVVDTDLQVHGISGLHVGGSSVFPTSSHANPTQMIVAMSVRLADTIKRRARLPYGPTQQSLVGAENF